MTLIDSGRTQSANTYDGLRALVLGGTGFIGGWVVRALSARGALVSLTARDVARAQAWVDREAVRATVIEADLSAPGAVRAVLEEASPAIVFNLAVHGVDHTERDPALMMTLNAELPGALCDELARTSTTVWSGQTLVQVGSALEYGEVSGAVNEEMVPHATTDYGRSKLAGTLAVQRVTLATGLRSVVARLFTVYGPGEHHGRLLPSLEEAARVPGRLRLTAGRQRRDFTYVEDAVEGLLRLGTSPADPGTIVNVATGRLTTVRTFVETAAAIMGINSSSLEFGALADRPDEMHHGDVDVTRLEALTSWRPSTSIGDGIRRAWEHQHVRS